MILYPTDTIWGIGCDATNPEAVARVYGIKRRSDSKALILLASDMAMVARYVHEIPPMAEALVEVNDRPMTIIYPSAIVGRAPEDGEKAVPDKQLLAYNIVAGDGSVGIRIPMMQFCHDLVYRFGRPIVSTSANVSGEPAPRCFRDISKTIVEAVDFVVDPLLERESTGRSSQIIKLEMDGGFKIIRK